MENGPAATQIPMRRVGKVAIGICCILLAFASCKENPLQSEITPPDTTVLPEPMRSLSIDSLSETTAQLSWVDEQLFAGDSSKYYYSLLAGSAEDSFRLVAKVPLTARSCTIQGRHLHGKQYSFRIEKWYNGVSTQPAVAERVFHFAMPEIMEVRIGAEQVALKLAGVSGGARKIVIAKSTGIAQPFSIIDSVLADSVVAVSTELLPNTDYYFKVAAIGAYNVSGWSLPALATYSHGGSITASVTLLSENEARIDWVYSGAGNPSAFVIEQYAQPATQFKRLTLVNGTTRSCTVSGCIVANSKMFFRVAEFSNGQYGSYSNTVIKEYIYAPLKAFTVSTVDEFYADLSWQVEGTNTRMLYIDLLNPSQQVVFTDSFPPSTVTYHLNYLLYAAAPFTVRLFGRSAYLRSAEVQAQLQFMPPPVKNLAVTEVEDTTALITWTESLTSSRKMVLSFQVANAPPVVLDTVPANAGKYRLNRLFSSDTTYSVRAMAFSPNYHTPTEAVLLLFTPQKVTNLSIDNITDSSAYISWSSSAASIRNVRLTLTPGGKPAVTLNTVPETRRGYQVFRLFHPDTLYEVKAMAFTPQYQMLEAIEEFRFVPASVTQLAVSNLQDDAFTLTWNYSGSQYASFRITMARQGQPEQLLAVLPRTAARFDYSGIVPVDTLVTIWVEPILPRYKVPKKSVSFTIQSIAAPKPTYVFLSADSLTIKYPTIMGLIKSYVVEMRINHTGAFEAIGTAPLSAAQITVPFTYALGNTYELRLNGKSQYHSFPGPSMVINLAPPSGFGGMVFVPAGLLQMGSADGEPDERPVHTVILSPFFIGQTEVTQKLWVSVMGAGSNNSEIKGDSLPVTNVTLNQAKTFLAIINQNSSVKSRLPTEAEWEWAARGANSGGNFIYSGSNEIASVGWYSQNSGNRPKPVATLAPNALGIYDMSGNAWEWCSDFYGRDYYGNSVVVNPTGPVNGTYFVLRGGSFSLAPWYARIAKRNWALLNDGNWDVGFRLVWNIVQ